MKCILLDLYLYYYCTNMFILDMAVGCSRDGMKEWNMWLAFVSSVEYLGSINCKEFFNKLWNC